MPVYFPSSGGGGGGSSNPAAGYDATILADSPTHYYKCLETHSAATLADAVGSQALTLNGNCQAGNAPLVPDGSGSIYIMGRTNTNLTTTNADYVSAPVGTFIPTSAGAFSVEFWCKLMQYPSSSADLFCSDSALHLRIATGAGGDSSQLTLNGGNAAPVVTFHYPFGTAYLAYTWDGTNSKLYLNAINVYSSTSSPAFPATGTTTFGIRADFNSATPVSMMLHKPASWIGTALTATQVMNHYKAGVPLL